MSVKIIDERFILARGIFFKQKTAYEICACLVGSEMCIRDRICGDDEQKWKESIDCGKNVMRSRIKFWDQILFEIKKTETN